MFRRRGSDVVGVPCPTAQIGGYFARLASAAMQGVTTGFGA